MPTAKGDRKTCSSCRRELALADFYANRGTKDGRTNQCRECMVVSHRRSYYKDPAKTSASRLASRRRRKYNLTEGQFQAIGAAIKWECPGCGQLVSAIDHSHATGDVRGLLCHRCNLALGHVGDNAAVLRALADYLDTQPHAALIARVRADIKPDERALHYNATKAHCKRGHPYDAANTRLYTRKDGVAVRFCIACERDRTARRVAAGEFRMAAPRIWYEE